LTTSGCLCCLGYSSVSRSNFSGKAESRFQREGLEGLRDKPRSGRPPDVSEEKLLEIMEN
jgi:transposase